LAYFTHLILTRLCHWLKNNTHRWQRWTKLFTGFALVQLLVQVLNALAGFLLIRTLDKPHYAWFTLASGMSAALSVLADAGIGSAVTSIGGTVWKDKKALSNLVSAALHLRRQMAFIAAVLVTPVSLWLLLRNGSTVQDATILTLVVLIPVWQISTLTIFNVVNRLHCRARQLQIADAAPAVCRVLLILTLVGFHWITPFTALLASLFAQALQYIIIRRQVVSLVNEQTNPALYASLIIRIRHKVRELYPNAVFTCIQSQLSVWLISMFAAVDDVADFGALSRFGLLFGIILGPINQWIAPAFSRANTRHNLIIIILGAILILCCLSIPMLFIAVMQPEWLLWILGRGYANLQSELVWVISFMTVHTLMSSLWGLNIARGWVKSLSWNIPLVLLTQATMLCFIKLNTLDGVIFMNIMVVFAQTIHAAWVAMHGIRNFPLSAKHLSNS
jgi:hypothetical protein